MYPMFADWVQNLYLQTNNKQGPSVVHTEFLSIYRTNNKQGTSVLHTELQHHYILTANCENEWQTKTKHFNTNIVNY